MVSLEQTNSSDTYMSPSTSSCDRVRCLTTWVGSMMHEGQHGGTLVCGRINPSHQLSGVTGGFSSSQNLRKHSKGTDSPENGQYFSSDIHKSEGRYLLNPTVQSSFGSLGMVSPEAINNPSRTSTRKPQFGCGLRVQNNEGSVQLDDKSKNFPENSIVSRTITNRSLCISPDKTATPLLQLEARSRSRSNRCLYPELGPSKGVCKPSVVSDSSVSEPNKTTTGQSTVSDTTLAISTLVSDYPQDVGGLSLSTSPNSGHNPEPHKSGVHNEARGPNTGRMACLRDSFASQGVSAQASELLLSSW